MINECHCRKMFYAPVSKDWGHIVFWPVHPFVCFKKAISSEWLVIWICVPCDKEFLLNFFLPRDLWSFTMMTIFGMCLAREHLYFINIHVSCSYFKLF
jgi:hypothetical protein